MVDKPDPDPAPMWVPRYLQQARADASAALDTARQVDATRGAADLAGEIAIAAAVRELSGEMRALRHQLAGTRAPRSGGLAGILTDVLEDIARRSGRSR